MQGIGIRPNDNYTNYAYKNNNTLKYVLIILLIIFGSFIIYNIYKLLFIPKDVISKNVFVENINLSGKNIEEAKEILNSSFNYLNKEEAHFKIADTPFVLSSKELEYYLDIDSSLEKAFEISKNNNFRPLDKKENIEIEAIYNKDKLDLYINEILKLIPKINEPEERYKIENLSLIIYKGDDPVKITREELKEIILKKFKSSNFKQVEEIPLTSLNQKIDLDKIFAEVEKEPKDAYQDKNGKIISEEAGVKIKITKDEAKKLFETSTSSFAIPLEIIEPKVKSKDLEKEDFPDKLTEIYLKYEDFNLNQKNIIKNKLESLSNIIIDSNKSFSYLNISNNVDELDSFIATGIYQVALSLNMDIQKVHKHKYLPLYCKTGLDAYISKDKDFKFRNNQGNKIKIVTASSNDGIYISIFGIKTGSSFEVKLYTVTKDTIPMTKEEVKNFHYDIGYTNVKQKGSDGKKLEVYKEIYINNKSNGKQLIGEYTYDMRPEIVEVGNKPSSARENSNNANNN